MVKKIKGSLTLLAGEDTRFEIRDEDAVIQFVRFEMSGADFAKALGRRANVPVEIEVRGLERIGKVREQQVISFEVPEHSYKDRHVVASKAAAEACPDGWEPPTYFGSQNSFFRLPGKEMARGMFLRWVEKPTETNPVTATDPTP